MVGRFVSIPVRAPELVTGGPSPNVQEQLRPTIMGRIDDDGCSKAVAYIVVHPSASFLNHFLINPMNKRGRPVLGLTTRYNNNDTMLLMERVIQDIGAGVKFLRDEGYERIAIIGNSAGGSLGSLYQSQAENLTITQTPDGLPIDIYPEDLPPIDGLALASGHIGRGRNFRNAIDPAVLDEIHPLSSDPELDMFNPDNGPPYSKEFVAKYKAAQGARHDRITEWVQGRLRELAHLPEDQSMVDQPFIMHRTYAKLETLDASLDPNDRPMGQSILGNARATNFSPASLGRVSSLRSFLSQWSLLSIGDGPARMKETSVPVLNVRFSADEGTYPSLTKEYSEAAGNRGQDYVLEGARHFPYKQPEGEKLVAELADTLVEWGRKL